jgi:hypothetical protein
VEGGRTMTEKARNQDKSTDIMKRYIVLLYYYRSPLLPKECFLKLSEDIAYRNMLLFRSEDNRIHFELPVFEDHTYNSICNYHVVVNLVENFNEYEEVYIVFRAKNLEEGESTIIGYYQIGKVYYQETNLFNRNGIVWGLKSDKAYLIRKNAINCGYKGRGSPTSKNKKWRGSLNELLGEIERHKNISGDYQEETKRLIGIFKDMEKMNEWKEYCKRCEKQKECKFFRRAKRYEKKNRNSDLFSAINRVYTNNLYSRNELSRLEKVYGGEWNGDTMSKM